MRRRTPSVHPTHPGRPSARPYGGRTGRRGSCSKAVKKRSSDRTLNSVASAMKASVVTLPSAYRVVQVVVGHHDHVLAEGVRTEKALQHIHELALASEVLQERPSQPGRDRRALRNGPRHPFHRIAASYSDVQEVRGPVAGRDKLDV